jgi:hypothetical protein
MADQTMRDELNDVKQHAKEAVRSTLMAMRTAVDFALNKLDGDEDAPKDSRGEPQDAAMRNDQPPSPHGD